MNTSNVTETAGSAPFLAVQLTCFAIIAAISIIANMAVFARIVRRGANRISDILILNLVSSDAAVGVFSIPLDIAERLSDTWPFGGFLCNVIWPLQTVLMSVSVVTLLFMSIERYRAIATPFKLKPSGKRVISLVIGIWLFSVVIASPYASILRYKDKWCSEFWPADSSTKIYTIAMFVILYVIPLSVITAVYSAIGVFLRKHTDKIIKATSVNTRDNPRHIKALAQRRHKRNVRIMKVFVAGVVAFAICQLPTHVIWLWSELGDGWQWAHFDDVKILCNVLTYLNSAIDPFIFGSLDIRCFSCIKLCGLRNCCKDNSASDGESAQMLTPSKKTCGSCVSFDTASWRSNTKQHSVESTV